MGRAPAPLAAAAFTGFAGGTRDYPGNDGLHRYYNHGPSNPHETPTGTFNVTVTGQSSNGVTAITNSTTMVLTVQ